MAPQLWVEKAMPICPPLADRVFDRYVPNVTNQPPQMKNWRNIIKLRRRVIIVIVILLMALSAQGLKYDYSSLRLRLHQQSRQTHICLAR